MDPSNNENWQTGMPLVASSALWVPVVPGFEPWTNCLTNTGPVYIVAGVTLEKPWRQFAVEPAK